MKTEEDKTLICLDISMTDTKAKIAIKTDTKIAKDIHNQIKDRYRTDKIQIKTDARQKKIEAKTIHIKMISKRLTKDNFHNIFQPKAHSRRSRSSLIIKMMRCLILSNSM